MFFEFLSKILFLYFDFLTCGADTSKLCKSGIVKISFDNRRIKYIINTQKTQVYTLLLKFLITYWYNSGLIS